jgi:hypothetical protein
MVIDVHTHMIPREWLDLLQRKSPEIPAARAVPPAARRLRRLNMMVVMSIPLDPPGARAVLHREDGNRREIP